MVRPNKQEEKYRYSSTVVGVSALLMIVIVIGLAIYENFIK